MSPIYRALAFAALFALMLIRPSPAHAFYEGFVELMEVLEMLGRSWVATADKYDKPGLWNGVWPQPKTTTILDDEIGGFLFVHENRFRDIARSGADVEIRAVVCRPVRSSWHTFKKKDFVSVALPILAFINLMIPLLANQARSPLE
jgi:hypothetical protein